MVISKLRRTVAFVVVAGLALAVSLSGSNAFAQQCATRLNQDQQHHPQYSGTLPNLLTTAGNDRYIYEATQYGFARASLANPSSPGPLQLLQIGQKFVPGDNGGLIYLGCDCYQGATTMDAAEGPDGSSRMISDFVATYTGVLKGMVGMTTGAGAPQFGDQININQVALGSNVAAVYSPGTGKYFGYFPSTTFQVVDLTSPNGSTAPSAALNVIGVFGRWNRASILKAGTVSIGGLQKLVLIAYVGGDLRIAEVDGNTGMPSETARIPSLGGSNSLYAANVNGKAYVFSADNSAGLNVYEYTGSALNFAGNIPGYFNTVIVKGNPGNNFPAIFLHRAANPDTVDIYDSKWLTSGIPTLAYALPHQGSEIPRGRGNALEAVVTGSGSQITAHVYRLATTTNPQVNPEHLLITDNIDISCIAADTTSPPTANASFTNVSAALRSGTERTIHYYGDRFTLTDGSSSGVPITRVDWDLNNPGSPAPLVPDAVGTATSLPNIFFPCDPSGATPGNLTTGSNCGASLGLPSTPGNQSFVFAEKSANQNGTSANTFYSSPIPFVMPDIGIAGFSGSVLRVLTGGSADASSTQGNIADATFQWSFTGGPGAAPTGVTVPVPGGATGFALTVTWKGGYTRTVTGSVVQTDLVAGFSISPNPAITSSTFTVTNTMQKSTTTTLTSVDYSITSGSCPGNPNFTGTLANSFLAPGTATLTAPAAAGSYCVTLRFNYTPQGQPPTNQTVSNPLTVQVQATPMSVTVSGPASGTVGTPISFTANPTGGTPPYTYEWDCNYSTFTGGNFLPGSATQSCSFAGNGTYTPGVRVRDSASGVTTGYGFVTITGGSTVLTASVAGPSTGSAGTPLTFSASASGGTGTFNYAWACDYTVLGGPGQFTAGSSSTTCTYNSNGSRTVAVRVTDTGSGSAIAQTTVSIGGGPGPGPGGVAVTVTGPATGSANSPISYTASASGGTPPYTYAWACDYNPVAPPQFIAGPSTKTCTYTGNGVHAVAVKATDSLGSIIVNTASTTISGPALPSVAFTIAGGTLVSGSTYNVPAGQPVTFTASEPNAASWGWAFGDSTAGTGRTITKTYATKGTYQGQLIVTGNGTQTSGVNIATFTLQAVTPAPSGAFTIAGAQGNADGTVFTASIGDEITMTASEPNAISWGWIFGDDTSGAARTVKKTYSQLGSYTVKLLVTGNERDTTGLVISTFIVNVVSCAANATTLCLNDNRFRATVEWSVPPQSKSGSGAGVALTGDTGYYWFFSPTNIELVLKVVDGRGFNGKFWVFYGALSNVEYTITIKDTKTGAVKTYHNAYGTTASLADVNAFDAGPASSPAKGLASVSALAVSCAPSSVTVNTPVTCTVTGASGSATYSWRWDGLFEGVSEPAGATNSHTYTTIGAKQVYVSVNDGTGSGSVSTGVAVTAPAAGSLVASITGPTTGVAGTALSFTGAATGGTGPYAYAWNCDYNAAAPSFTSGTSQNTCNYATTGSHTVALRVTDSATPTAATSVSTATVIVSPPAGPGLPSAAFTIEGATLNAATGKYEAEVGQPITFTAVEENAATWGWAFGDGKSASAKSVTYSYPQGGGYTGQLIVTGDGTRTIGLSIATIPIAILPCAADAKTLCLNGGRFKVRVDWKSQSSSGFGTAVLLTSDTGEFWFLSSNNIELVIKVVDGTSLNGHFWVFYGALSNLEYTITVTDTTTGAVKTYHNPLGTTASMADVNAF